LSIGLLLNIYEKRREDTDMHISLETSVLDESVLGQRRQ